MSWYGAKWGVGGFFLLAFLHIVQAQEPPLKDLAISPPPVISPDEFTILKAFEGKWGYHNGEPRAIEPNVRIESCSGPGALFLRFQEVMGQFGMPRNWRIGLHPDEDLDYPGILSLVKRVEQEGRKQRVTVSWVADVAYVFERDGERLTVSGYENGKKGQSEYIRCQTAAELAAAPELPSEDELAIMKSFEGEWGYVEPRATSLGKCGGPNTIRVIFRNDMGVDGTWGWNFRQFPSQLFGSRVERVKQEGNKQRISTRWGTDLIHILERDGDRLTVFGRDRTGSSRTDYIRCQK